MINAWPCQSCFRDLIDVTLNEEDTDPEVVNIVAFRFGVGEELTIASM